MIWLAILLGAIATIFALTAFTGAPYVPTRPRDVGSVFEEAYRLTSRDTVVDIGSGDGLVLRAAARQGAKAVGYEINPVLVLVSRLLARGNPRITVKLANYWTARFPDDVTVVYTFGDSRDIKKMAKKVRTEATRLARPLIMISYAFEIPDATEVARSSMHFVYRIEPLHQ